MNPEILSIIQAELDGTASPAEIARLDTAAASDAEIRTLRGEYGEIARAVGRMAVPVVPHGFATRVMAALPPPARVRVPARDRIRSIVQSIVPSHRQQVALAFALGVLATFMVTLTVTDWTQPDSDMVSGTIKAPSGATVPFYRNAGVLEAAWIDGVRRITVRPREAMSLRVVVSGPVAEPPAVEVEVADGTLTLERSGGDVVLTTGLAGVVRFSVPGQSDIRIRVESQDEVLVDWTPVPGEP